MPSGGCGLNTMPPDVGIYKVGGGDVSAPILIHSEDPSIPRIAAIQRGIAAGERLPDTHPELLVDAIFAPIYYRLLLRSAPLSRPKGQQARACQEDPEAHEAQNQAETIDWGLTAPRQIQEFVSNGKVTALLPNSYTASPGRSIPSFSLEFGYPWQPQLSTPTRLLASTLLPTKN